MEELQDAIEDAQYVSAISAVEDGPRPVLPWLTPEPEQLASWKEKLLKKHADDVAKSQEKAAPSNKKIKAIDKVDLLRPFEFEWTLAHALGFFLFSAYLKESAKEHVDINFMEEVQRWRNTRGRFRAEKTGFIVKNYLAPPPPGTIPAQEAEGEGEEKEEGEGEKPSEPAEGEEPNKSDEPGAAESEPAGESAAGNAEGGDDKEKGEGEGRSEGVEATTEGTDAEDAAPAAAPKPKPRRTLVPGPPKMEIVEYDLCRVPPDFKPEDLEELVKTGTDPRANCVGVGGPVLDAILRRTDKLQKAPGYHSLPSLNEEQSMEENGDEATGEGGIILEQGGGLMSLVPVPEEERKPRPKSERELREMKKKQRSLRNLSLVSNELPQDLFDEAEAVVAASVKERHWEGFQRSPYHEKLLNFLWFQDRTVVEEDFFVMRVLGRGGFGLVTACKKGTSGKLYAMKVMNKKRIKLKKAEQLTLNEQKCLSDINSPFVVNLKYSFQSPTDVFLILDLMTGGDLSYHLSQKGRFPLRECLYYGARIMLGLQALHDKGYVYRDLKPENCLLGEDGRVKLTDLGLATKVTSNLHGAAGTRGYWAPEMLKRDENGKRMNYNHMVDWFSFGCCLAEFISGTNPFRSEAALNFGLEKGKKTKEKAIDYATLEMQPDLPPERYDENAADICRQLLDKNPATRMGAKTGSKEIMAHPWFRGYNWEEIISDRMRPPFIPPKDVNAASQSEIGTFAEDKAFHDTVLSDKDAAVYSKWDFTNEKAFAAEVIEFLIYERTTGEPLLPIQPGSSCCCTII